MKRYWPLLLLALVVATVVGMSQYAENTKQHCEERASEVKAAAVAKGDDKEANNNAKDTCKPKIWARYFTWPEGVGAWAVVLTLFVIAWQSIETRAAAQATKASADGVEKQSVLMTRQADAMDAQTRDARDRERARLVIRYMDTPELYPAGSTMNGALALKVRVVVENLGGSRAFNVRAWGMTNIGSDRLGDNYDVGIQQVFPSIIEADQKKHFLNVSGLGREFEGVASVSDYQAIPEELGQRIRNGEVFIVASGNVAYEDIFLDTYVTPFHFVWHSFGNDDGSQWLTESYWLDRSERPRRVHAEQEDKPQNPN